MVRVLHGRIGTVPIYISSLLEIKLDGAKKASFTFAYFFNYFATCIPRFAHGNCSKYIPTLQRF
jgi:hypothetical protein